MFSKCIKLNRKIPRD